MATPKLDQATLGELADLVASRLGSAAPQAAPAKPDRPAIKGLKPVIVRTTSAGAHFGYLVKRDGMEVELVESRRLWQWFGAWTLSEIATSGLDANKSKIGAPVSITLTQAIEIIDCNPAAVDSIEAAKWAK